jgi:serine/threonine protein kinase
MEPHIWDRIQEIYHSAVPIPPGQRCEFVARECSFDPVLTKQICSLLKDDSHSEFLQAPIFSLGLRILSRDDPSDLFDSAAAIDDDHLIGSTIDERYVVEKLLAEGGMARVYLARHLRVQPLRVVVKVLLDKSLRNERIRQKFDDEREALALVSHPGVVQIIDAGKLTDEKPYLVMQYVEGVSLREVLAATSEGMPFDRAASIIKEIGAALNAVHEKEIYHRDLKPENIMLERAGTADEHVMIVDFGIAKVTGSVLSPSTMTGAGAMGTIAYMSPEQLRGDAATAASDLYSFAVIAYEMFTGRRPFVADTGAHLRDMQRDGIRVKPKDLRPRLPAMAQDIILRALSFEAKHRGPGAKRFGESLARALSQSPSRERERRPNRWLIFASVAFLLLVAVAGAYWWSSRRALLGSAVNSRSSPSLPHRTLTYSFTVQKFRDGLPYRDPFESSGNEVFENGDKFRFNLSSRQAGYIYVFNEGPPENNQRVFTVIYPTPAIKAGSARLEQNEDLQSHWNTFGGPPGTERFWIIWSATKQTPLEIALDEAFTTEQGAITDTSIADSLRAFLSEHSDPEPETTKDNPKQRTTVRVNGEVLVKLLELQHR